MIPRPVKMTGGVPIERKKFLESFWGTDFFLLGVRKVGVLLPKVPT